MKKFPPEKVALAYEASTPLASSGKSQEIEVQRIWSQNQPDDRISDHVIQRKDVFDLDLEFQGFYNGDKTGDLVSTSSRLTP